MLTQHLTPSRFGLFLATFALSASAIAAAPFVPLGKSLADVPPCRVEEASRKEHPPQSPAEGPSGIKVIALIDVALELKADTTAAPTPTAGSEPADLAWLQASDAQVRRSTRNRDLDRLAMQTARKWRYVCPSSVPEAQRWARVEIEMDPAVTGPEREPQPLHRTAVGHFPSWLKAELMQGGQRVTHRDDRLMPGGSIAEITGRVQADPAFKKDEIRKPFAMYGTWDERTQTARIWWLSDERSGRGNAAVLIRDDYRNNTRTYAVRCESSATVCATFDQWLESIIRTWYPLATWDATPTPATRPR